MMPLLFVSFACLLTMRLFASTLRLMGVTYLMKLRYGQLWQSSRLDMAPDVCVALMPWLNKYRIRLVGKAEDEATESKLKFFGLCDIFQLYRVDNHEDQDDSSLMTRFKSLRSSYAIETTVRICLYLPI
jgi:hypothetical protein